MGTKALGITIIWFALPPRVAEHVGPLEGVQVKVPELEELML